MSPWVSCCQGSWLLNRLSSSKMMLFSCLSVSAGHCLCSLLSIVSLSLDEYTVGHPLVSTYELMCLWGHFLFHCRAAGGCTSTYTVSLQIVASLLDTLAMCTFACSPSFPFALTVKTVLPKRVYEWNVYLATMLVCHQLLHKALCATFSL